MTNVIGLCQSSNLRIFAGLIAATRDDANWGRIGVFTADARAFRHCAEAREMEQAHDTVYLKEWESVLAGLRRGPDHALLAEWEARLGAPSLWAAILADRRLIFGRHTKARQDYCPRYSEAELLGVLCEALERVDALFAGVRPDLVIGFVPVTLHEYLILRMARARGIPVLLLRSTKIENYIAFNDQLFGLSGHATALMEAAPSDTARTVAARYIESTRARGAAYEGMHNAAHAARRFRPASALRHLAGAILDERRKRRDPELASDPHQPGYLVPAIYREVIQPWRAAKARRLMELGGGLVGEIDLDGFAPGGFCLFPLHFEPEIALQIYARPLQNQIEVARTIALSLPAGMKLVVKEHPRSAGFRPPGYYRRLLEIPNVVLADAAVPSVALVRRASLVTVITGNIGLEAATLGKPVIVLGETEYGALPRHMVRTCHDLYQLSAEIKDLLANHRFDEAALTRFLSAVVDGAVPVDLYGVLLDKGGRHRFDSDGDFTRSLQRLRRYARMRIGQVLAEPARTAQTEGHT